MQNKKPPWLRWASRNPDMDDLQPVRETEPEPLIAENQCLACGNLYWNCTCEEKKEM